MVLAVIEAPYSRLPIVVVVWGFSVTHATTPSVNRVLKGADMGYQVDLQ